MRSSSTRTHQIVEGVPVIAHGVTLDGKYIVVGRLGGGGFGEVFLAEDQAIPGRQLALKVLSSESAGTLDDLIWEMRALSQLNHPGVVVFHHHFTHEGQLILVMEYCAAGSLADRLHAGGAVPLDEAFRWAIVLCGTLAFVHGKGIVHHDIKPANILFSHDGAIRLGDFGVANRYAGTRLYMPPEMLAGGSLAKTDPRVDVYAMGLTLLEMLSGKHPFASLSSDAAFMSRVAQDFVPQTLPRWAQDILLRATHPTPELRFQDMAQFGEAILGKHVPYVFDGNRVQAHALAEKSASQLARLKWRAAEKLASQGLRVCPNSTAALVAAGRSQLFIRRLDAARSYFSRALAINPRIHVQKELGWLNLEEGNLPIAISLLSDHLDRNASDFEAYNLLLKCFFLSERYEAGESLAGIMVKQKAPSGCFRSNRFLCRLLNGDVSEHELRELNEGKDVDPSVRYNVTIATEAPRSWAPEGKPALREKVVFEEYRFGRPSKVGTNNPIALRFPDGSLKHTAQSLVSIGSLLANDVALSGRSVSRRHGLIVNLPGELWLHDLGSVAGIWCDGERVCGRTFLDSVHRLNLGGIAIEVAARADLLV